ncbi:DoxX family protein [Marivirga sp. S37H4]|uniref:DoxX family protein n=1 Tax=Marivirga aurantiaca TaxID=2802615 RepID=A0A934WVR2_9BACT|nr:DoxX family protein [Marivirga aurantiaca]MBK6263852.1 DoxX family protein [Marivirga aurantiaca]
MKLKSTLYWASTLLVVLVFTATGILNLMGNNHILTDILHLGFPTYIMKILGFWKVGAAISILLPKTVRLKEWAYAGMLFDLSGAAFSRMSIGDPAQMIIIPLLIMGLVVISWISRPESKSGFSIVPKI